jgi:23S rRNA pseudoU1915 N3-methylase RlmH
MTKDVKVISLDGADEEDESFAEFIETLRTGNESVVFLVSKEDGSLSIGSNYKSAKDLLWDIERLRKFMGTIVEGGIE